MTRFSYVQGQGCIAKHLEHFALTRKGFEMGFRVNTNIGVIYAHQNSTLNNKRLDKNLEALGSGLRINKAADDAAGMAISSKLSVQSKALGQAIRNANDGIGLIQTADGAMEEMSKIAQRIRVLAVEGANDSQDADSRSYLNKEIQALYASFENIRNTTSYNGIHLLDSSANTSTSAIINASTVSGSTVDGNSIVNASTVTNSTITGSTINASNITNSTIIGTLINAGSATNANIVNGVVLSGSTTGTVAASNITSGTGKFVFHTGAYSNDTISVTIGDASMFSLYSSAGGMGFLNLNPVTRTDFESLVQDIDYVLKGVDLKRSTLGATQNKLESIVRNISVTQVNVENARSQMMDVDFASESADFSKHNIITQSGSYALSQANATNNNIMSLFQ